MPSKSRIEKWERPGWSGQGQVYEYEVYNDAIDAIYREYCEFTPKEIENATTYYFRRMEIGIEKLKNWLTEEDRMDSNSPYQLATLEDLQAAPEEDLTGIPDQTFKYRDLVLKKAEVRYRELLKIYNLPLPIEIEKKPAKQKRRSTWVSPLKLLIARTLLGEREVLKGEPKSVEVINKLKKYDLEGDGIIIEIDNDIVHWNSPFGSERATTTKRIKNIISEYRRSEKRI